MEFVPVDGRGLHFKRHRTQGRGAYHLEALGNNVDVVPRRTTLRHCVVLRSNASFPKLRRDAPISVELQLPPEAVLAAEKLVQCLATQDSSAAALLRKGADGASCLLVTAPSSYFNRWSRQECRMAVWGPGVLDVGRTVTVVLDGRIRKKRASLLLIETCAVE